MSQRQKRANGRAGGDREDDLRLVESARDHGIVERIILAGDEQAVRRAADGVGVHLADADVIGAESQEEMAARTVECVEAGGVDLILKGNISTPILNRAILRLRVRDTVSLVTVFDAAPIADGRPMLLTDPGVTTVCGEERMVGLGTFAGVTVGVMVPYVILSRSDSVGTKLHSIGLCSIAREWLNMERPAAP